MCYVECNRPPVCVGGVVYPRYSFERMEVGCSSIPQETSCPPVQRGSSGMPCEHGCVPGAQVCNQIGSFQPGDWCEPTLGCHAAQPLNGPHGLYTPTLTCEEGVCVETPREWCNGVDDTLDGVVDEGCALRLDAIALTDAVAPRALVERPAGLAWIDDTPDGAVLHVLDETLVERASFALPDGTAQVIAVRDDFAILSVIEGVATLSVRSASDVVIGSMALPAELAGARLVSGDDPFVLVDDARVVTLSLETGVTRDVEIGPHRLVGALEGHVLACTGDGTTWIADDLTTLVRDDACAPLMATGDQVAWGVTGTFRRYSREDVVSFASSSLLSGRWYAVTATDHAAVLWATGEDGALRVTRMDDEGVEQVFTRAASDVSVLDAVTIGEASAALAIRGSDAALWVLSEN